MNRNVRAMVAAAALPLAFAAVASAQSLITVGSPAIRPPSNPVFNDSVNYLYDDGTVENGVGIGGTTPFDIIWLNRFTVQPGGEIITDIQAAFGSPSDTRNYNGLPLTLLVYSDIDGGGPGNASLLTSFNTTVTNGNTGILNSYDITDTLIPTTEFWVAVLMANLPGGAGFVAAIDQTLPHTAGVSYAGFTSGVAIDPNNLGAIPATNIGTIEGFNLAGNWALRASAVPAPGSIALLGLGGLLAARRRRA